MSVWLSLLSGRMVGCPYRVRDMLWRQWSLSPVSACRGVPDALMSVRVPRRCLTTSLRLPLRASVSGGMDEDAPWEGEHLGLVLHAAEWRREYQTVIVALEL